MAFRYMVVVLAMTTVASHFNAVLGSSSPSPNAENVHVTQITDIANEVKDNAAPVIENLKQLIEKHVQEIKDFRSLHPDIDNNAELSATVGQAIRDNILGTVSSHIKDIIDAVNKTKEQGSPAVDSFVKLIENHVNEIKKFQSLYPDIEDNAEVASKVNEIINSHIQKAVTTRVKDRIDDFFNSARFSPQVHKVQEGTRQDQRNHREQDRSNHYTNHREQDRSNHYTNHREQDRSNHDTNHREQNRTREHNTNHREQDRTREHNTDHREQDRTREHNTDHREQDRTREHNTNHREQDRTREHNTNHREHTSIASPQSNVQAGDNSNGRSNNPNRKTPEQVRSLVQNIAGYVKELKSTIRQKVEAKKEIIESNLSNKFASLREAAHQPALANANEDNSGETEEVRSAEIESSDADEINTIFPDVVGGSTRNPEVVETDAQRALRRKTEEQLASALANLKSSEQEFLNSKEKMAEAANKLHESSGDHNQTRPFDFAALLEFKSSLHEMLIKKAKFIQDKIELNNKFKHVFDSSTPGPSPLTSTDISASNSPANEIDELPEVSPTSAANRERDANSSQSNTQAVKNSAGSGGDGLKMAASAFNGEDSVADQEGSPTVVVIIVLSCLVIAAIVGVLSVMVWRRHRRHRLYVRIPGGHVAARAGDYDSCGDVAAI